MEPVTIQRKKLKVKGATPEALEPYGQILGANPNVAPLPIDFYGGAVKVRRVVDFQSDEQTELTLTTVNRRPMEARWMERHFKHTQTFVPLSGRPFVVVMAPPNDKELPDLDKVEAFLFDGSAGFTMRIGTWHEFPFALVDETNIIVILRKEATQGLMKDNVIQDEASSPDLDKKDLLARKKVVYEIEL
ncbi:MAG: ureidoglycolate lyase [Acidobacteria bacterium]|nr:ureidoglycolate lyase [Acidobacteriota bacterium]